ncbi:MAG: AraC family transcriptional regulator [Phycisphaerae bacterium]|nr:AraC family transcriptional regulator [Phycisphaerae bacterium]
MKIRLDETQRVQFDLGDVQLPEIPVFGIDRQMYAEPGLPAHIHEGLMEIHFIKQGEQVFHVDGRDYPIRGGEMFVTWPDEVHSSGGQPHSRCLIYWTQFRLPRGRASLFGLTAAHAQPLLRELRNLPRRHFAASESIATLFEEMFTIRQNAQHPSQTIEIASRFVQWLLEVVRCAQIRQQGRMSPDITAVVRRIERDPSANPTLRELADSIHLSLSRFKAKFKRQTGLPPREFLLRCKIDRARRWLRDTEMSITMIAYRLGFSSSQNFATTFKRYVSLPPREFRAGKPPKVQEWKLP